MSKFAIIYDTRSGVTRRCAEILQKKLISARLIDLKNEHEPDISDYQAVIVGGSIRFGRLSRRAERYLQRHEQELAGRRCGYFICCGLSERAEEQLKQAIPPQLYSAAVAIASFGGEIVAAQRGPLAKVIARMAINEAADQMPHIDIEAIENFSELIIKSSWNSR